MKNEFQGPSEDEARRAQFARVTETSRIKIALGQAEWLAKGYSAPFDCAAKSRHGIDCGCVCDENGNRID